MRVKIIVYSHVVSRILTPKSPKGDLSSVIIMVQFIKCEAPFRGLGVIFTKAQDDTSEEMRE
jgi:hypothetical protein